MREWPGDFADYLRARLEGGLVIPATRYIEALALRGPMLMQFLRESLGRTAALFCPMIPYPLPSLNEVSIDGPAPQDLARAARHSTLTRMFNYLGVPALSVPCGFDRHRLPVAFQLIGRPFTEGPRPRLSAGDGLAYTLPDGLTEFRRSLADATHDEF